MPGGVDAREADLVLERLNLPMLLLDLGSVEGIARNDGERRLRAIVALDREVDVEAVGTVVGRLLGVPLVRRVSVDRSDTWGIPELTTTCLVALAPGDWELRLDLVARGTLQ
jgi:hypothetical protein